MYTTLNEIKAAANASARSNRFFGEENTELWRMRVLPTVYPAGEQGTFFITSDQPDPDEPRLYSVRFIDANGEVKPVTEDLAVFPVNATRLEKLSEAHNKAQLAVGYVARQAREGNAGA